jgi:hypothetical protein
MHGPLHHTLEPKRVVRTLSWVAGLLLVLHMASAFAWAHGDFLFLKEWRLVTYYGHVEMLDLDAEKGFGTWFAAVILLLAGRLLLLISQDSRQGRDGLWGWWLVLAVGFHVLSLDEVAGMHEYVNAYADDFGWGDTRWTTYALVLVLMVFAGYVPFLVLMLKQGHKRTVGLLVAAGAIYLGGAVIVEKISPDENELMSSMSYNLGWITLEEGLEMAGIILMIYTLLDYLRGGRDKTIQLVVGTAGRTTS